MSTMIEDLQNLAGEADPDERLAQAARIDACIDELVKGSSDADELRGQVEALTAERDEALRARDEFRDRFVDIYFKQNDTKQPPQQTAPQGGTIKPVIRGAADLCGGWKKG